MFERFRRPRGADASEGSVATREREATRGPRDHVAPGRDHGDREGAARRGSIASRPRPDTALDRERARDDLARDDVARRDDPVTRDDTVLARTPPGNLTRTTTTTRAAAARSPSAARPRPAPPPSHHHETEREEAGARRPRARDGERAAAFDRAPADRTDRDRDHDLATTPDGPRPRPRPRRRRRPPGAPRPVLAPAALATMRARQRARFGGIQWGGDFFGWLCAIGLASLLTAALVGAGVALGLSTDDATNADTATRSASAAASR